MTGHLLCVLVLYCIQSSPLVLVSQVVSANQRWDKIVPTRYLFQYDRDGSNWEVEEGTGPLLIFLIQALESYENYLPDTVFPFRDCISELQWYFMAV